MRYASDKIWAFWSPCCGPMEKRPSERTHIAKGHWHGFRIMKTCHVVSETRQWQDLDHFMPFSGPLSWSWGKITLPIHNNGNIPFICHDNLWNTFWTRLRYFSGPFVLVRRWNNQSSAHLRLKAFMRLLGHGNRPDYVYDTRRAARLLMDPLLATDGETTSHYTFIVAQLKNVISNLNHVEPCNAFLRYPIKVLGKYIVYLWCILCHRAFN